MAEEHNQSNYTPLPPKSPPIPGEQDAPRSERSVNVSEIVRRLLRKVEIYKDDVAKATAKPFHPRDPEVWGVLTAISNKARKRKQGLNMVLKANVHFIGRLVEDYQFQIDSRHVSGEHCKIYRQTFFSEDDALKSQPDVFLKDTSLLGTYVNGLRYTRREDAVQIHHGDVISFIASPNNTDTVYTFVYREVVKSAASLNGIATKRKAEEELGFGAPQDCLSFDDFRSLQHSNKQLRKQLEEMKNQIEEYMLDPKHKELVEASAEQKHTVDDDLNGRVLQSYTEEADEIMSSCKEEVRGVSS